MLDRTKPFGTISGVCSSAPTARYTQGDKLFNAQDKPVEHNVPDVAPNKPVAPPPPPSVVKERLEAALKKAEIAAAKKPTPSNRNKVDKAKANLASHVSK